MSVLEETKVHIAFVMSNEQFFSLAPSIFVKLKLFIATV